VELKKYHLTVHTKSELIWTGYEKESKTSFKVLKIYQTVTELTRQTSLLHLIKKMKNLLQETDIFMGHKCKVKSPQM
jgi:hypothetical protein